MFRPFIFLIQNLLKKFVNVKSKLQKIEKKLKKFFYIKFFIYSSNNSFGVAKPKT